MEAQVTEESGLARHTVLFDVHDGMGPTMLSHGVLWLVGMVAMPQPLIIPRVWAAQMLELSQDGTHYSLLHLVSGHDTARGYYGYLHGTAILPSAIGPPSPSQAFDEPKAPPAERTRNSRMRYAKFEILNAKKAAPAIG